MTGVYDMISDRYINNKYRSYRFILAIAATMLNVLLSYFASEFGLPLYLDCIGVVLVAMVAGSLPGIFVAVMTNALCVFYYRDSIYYSLISVLIAIISADFIEKNRYKKHINYMKLIVELAVLSGIMGIIFQLILLGDVQFDQVADVASYVATRDSAAFYIVSTLLLIAINVVDKGMSVMIAVLIYNLIPSGVSKRIWNCSFDMNASIKREGSSNRKSIGKRGTIRNREAVMVLIIVVSLAFVFTWVNISTNYGSDKEDAAKKAVAASSYVASFVDGDRIEEYLSDSSLVATYKNESYTYTSDMIRLFFDTYGDLDELSVYKIDDGRCRMIFACDDAFAKDGVVGQLSDLDKDMLYDLEHCTNESGKGTYSAHTRYGYSISSYVPVYDSEGDRVAYVVATVKTNLRSDYVRRYGMHSILLLSGVLMLVLSYGLWETGHHVVTPIESLEKSIDGFMDGIDDQNMLDKSVKELQKLDIRSGDEIERLYKSVCEMAVGTTEQMRNIRFLAKTKDKMQNGIIITMAEMVENRDSDTGAHIKKTAAYVRIILESLRRKGYYTEKLTDKYIAEVEMSAPLHDIGKINISDVILNKHGKLTDEEYAIMKTHTTAGKEILDDAISTIEGESYLKEARNMAAYHHEKWDGTGYPEGLHGQVIPLSARVMAVADVFDALVSPRVYKEAFPLERALEIIKDGSGKHFDPKCVEAFFDALPEIKAVMKKYQENNGGIS